VSGRFVDLKVVKADAWHHLSDAITSGLAFIGITTGLATGNAAADDWAALCASPIILFNGIQQLRPPIRALLDTAPSTNLEEEVRWVSRTASGEEGVEKCFIRKMGFKFYVDLHVLVDGRISGDAHRSEAIRTYHLQRFL
jgi:divalent metal cation (Fe/Co/Zn/Cd) transporter